MIELEISMHAWEDLHVCGGGTAIEVPAALRDLFSASKVEAAQAAYWRLENSVVVQGQLYDAALATTWVLMAGLATDGVSSVSIVAALELLFQITHGVAHEDEIARGSVSLRESCIDAARTGLWSLYREWEAGTDVAREVLELVETDHRRLEESIRCFRRP
jgi:hypothetical protein